MVFDKNSETLHNICLVQIKSADASVDIPELTAVYHTPSKIRFSNSSKNDDNGIIHRKSLSLFYPGLSSVDFEKFNDLVRGVYQIMVKLKNDDIYELSPFKFPMECKTDFTYQEGHVLLFTSDSPITVKYRGNQPIEGIDEDGFNYTFDFYLS